MNTIAWILLVTTYGANTSPVVVGRFDSEAKCEAAADQVRARSSEKGARKGYWMITLQGACVPAELAKGQP
jgi:hypothetical protein